MRTDRPTPSRGDRDLGVHDVTQVTIALHRNAAVVRWIIALPLLLAAVVLATTAQARRAPDSFADLVEKLLPTVVNISTTQTVEQGRGTEEFEEFFREFFERRGGERPQRRQQSSLGSGFIIDSAGYIVTNHHVIAEADEISVILTDDTRLEATIVGSDEKTDIALLKVESPTRLPTARWGKSEATRIGDWVIAIGNPFGLGGTVTAGIVSARQRDINAGRYDNFLQTDAAINKGNSGGPMFNLDGQVIGVNTAIFSPNGGNVGIGFAIPAELAKQVVAQLQEKGSVKRGWLGIRIQPVTPEIAESLGKKDLVSIKALQLSVSNGTEVGHNSWDGSHLRTTRIAAGRAYVEAGVENPREEISMTEVHDCFSITELVTMEDLGIAKEGAAVTDVLDGEFDARGKVPCQIDGGLKCFGHPIGASGLRMLYEMYLQFQERAGDRQLDNLKLGLTHNLGGFPASNVASISIIGRYKD